MSNYSQPSPPLAVRSLKHVGNRGKILNKTENQGSVNLSGQRLKEPSSPFKLKVEKQMEISQAEELLQTEPSILLSKSMAAPKIGSTPSKPFIIKKQTNTGAQRVEAKPEGSYQLISKQSEMNPFSSRRPPAHGFGRMADFSPKTTFRHDILSMTGYNPDKEKHNQDYARYHLFTMRSGLAVRIYALADGHGSHGAQASRIAVDTLVGLVESKLLSQPPDGETSENIIKHLVEESFEATHNFMKADRERRFKYSGTTMVLVVVHNNVIYFCNAGDSRAILGSVAPESPTSECVCTFESQLHKPELPEEEERIKSFGGIVSPFLDEETGEFLGPQRVWNSVRREPGLATSRTLGDVLAHSLGVTFKPGKRCLTQKSTSGK